MNSIAQIGQSRQRGAAALEFAIVAMLVMIPMVLGIWQLGTALSEYNTLAKSVRDATRYLTLHQPGTRTDAAACLVRFGRVSIVGGIVSCPYAPNECLIPSADKSTCAIAPANVAICEATSCPATHAGVMVTGVGTINLVTVTVSGYTYASWVPSLIADIAFRPISNTMRAPL